MAKIVFRFSVPCDGEWHRLAFAGPIVHVACRKIDAVEFWAIDDGTDKQVREFMVAGTGEAVDGTLEHVGTALTAPRGPALPHGAFVWHLFERPGGAS